jgi:uncharacterized protein YndB with AHSA1/START domain
MAETTSVVAEPGERTIVITRIFDAPARLVWRASTEPELIKQWWGPCVSTMELCESDLRVGGRWRHELRFPDGSRHGFGGVYREIVPLDRIVRTFVYDPFPDSVAIETAEMRELNGITRLTVTILHASVEARDGHIGSGMERGLAETHRRLDELLRDLTKVAA